MTYGILSSLNIFSEKSLKTSQSLWSLPFPVHMAYGEFDRKLIFRLRGKGLGSERVMPGCEIVKATGTWLEK